jgi:hypothetical protein
MAKLPIWYLRAVLRVVIRERRREERFESLLGANLSEHEQVAALDSSLDRYRAITGRLLLLAGSSSPSFMTNQPLDLLRQTVEPAELDILEGIDHLGPDEKAPEAVARRVLTFMDGTTS